MLGERILMHTLLCLAHIACARHHAVKDSCWGLFPHATVSHRTWQRCLISEDRSCTCTVVFVFTSGTDMHVLM